MPKFLSSNCLRRFSIHNKVENYRLIITRKTIVAMANPSIVAEKVWYEASCHCGNVKYKALLRSLDEYAVLDCNCSICTKLGYLLVYPLSKDVVFHQGYDTLKDYEFATRTRDHKFCPACGSSLLIDFRGKGRSDMALNVKGICGVGERFC